MNSKQKFQTTLFWILFLGAILLRIWLMIGVPKRFVYGPMDDLFYAKAAHYLIHGEWMGPYNQLTLIKAPFYSFFMIGSFLTGLPLMLNETIFYVLACVLIFFALSPLVKSNWLRLVLFIALLFCPSSLATTWNLRVYREFVYFGVTLFVIATSVGFFVRLDKPIRTLFPWAIGLGLSMGAFLLTREEGVWIYPAILLFLVSCLLFIWFKHYEQKWKKIVLTLSIILIWSLPVQIISILNYTHYGFYGVTENTDKDFTRLINALGRIETSEWYPYSPVTKESFEKAYSASPLLKELQVPIDDLWDNWMASAENSYENTPDWYREKYAPEGGEIAGYVSWLMRDALSVAGKFSEGTYPRAYIRETADQIIAACDSGQLDCTNQISIPRLGAYRADHLPIFFDYIKEDLHSLFSYDNSFSRIFPLSITQGAFTKTNSKFDYFEEFVNNPIDMRTMLDRVNADNRVMVGKHNELRLVMLNLKQRLMGYSVAVYKYLTLVFLILTTGFWLISIIFRLSKKQKIAYSSTINLALFFLVLFGSRLGMLDLLRATSTLPGSYAATCYLFMYCFSFFLLTGAINNFEAQNPEKTINQDESLSSE